jgi:hypothetical protein
MKAENDDCGGILIGEREYEELKRQFEERKTSKEIEKLREALGNIGGNVGCSSCVRNLAIAKAILGEVRDEE